MCLAEDQLDQIGHFRRITRLLQRKCCLVQFLQAFLGLAFEGFDELRHQVAIITGHAERPSLTMLRFEFRPDKIADSMSWNLEKIWRIEPKNGSLVDGDTRVVHEFLEVKNRDHIGCDPCDQFPGLIGVVDKRGADIGVCNPLNSKHILNQ